MSAVHVTTSATDFVNSIRDQLLLIRAETMEAAGIAAEESMVAGTEVAQERIRAAVTPTGLARAAAGNGEPGRIEDSHFIEDFTHVTEAVDENHLSSHLGWIDGGVPSHSADPSYFVMQDNGFNAGGVTVPGVHALLDAYAVTAAEFKNRLTTYVEREFG